MKLYALPFVLLAMIAGCIYGIEFPCGDGTIVKGTAQCPESNGDSSSTTEMPDPTDGGNGSSTNTTSGSTSTTDSSTGSSSGDSTGNDSTGSTGDSPSSSSGDDSSSGGDSTTDGTSGSSGDGIVDEIQK